MPSSSLKTQTCGGRSQPQIHLLWFAIHKKCKTIQCPKVENEILNIVHVQCILHLLKARTTMGNIFLSHSYILIFPPQSLFSITLILICITLPRHIVRKQFLFPLHCIALQDKCHILYLIHVICTWCLGRVCVGHHILLHWSYQGLQILQQLPQTLYVLHPGSPSSQPMWWRTTTNRIDGGAVKVN